MRILEVFTGSLGLLIAAVIFYLIRRDHMHARFSIWWIVMGVLAVVFGFFPGAFDWAGEWLGVAYPPVLGLISAVVALLLKILFADLERSRMRRDMLRLTQRLLLVEEQLREAREQEAPRDDAAEDLRSG